MNIEAYDILGAGATGIGATLVMDFWNLLLKHMFGICTAAFPIFIRQPPFGIGLLRVPGGH